MKNHFNRQNDLLGENEQDEKTQSSNKNYDNQSRDPITYFFYHPECHTFEKAVEQVRRKIKKEEDLSAQQWKINA